MFYKKIMLAVDGSETSHAAIEEVIKLVKGQGTKVKLIHVVDASLVYSGGPGFDYASFIEVLRDEGRTILNNAACLFEQSAAVEVEKSLVEIRPLAGRISDEIAQAAQEWPADLLVIGTHGRRGFSRFFLGSIAEHVVRIATVPVLLVRGAHE